ncbi:hypothetical protein [Arenibacter sp. S6351L]|uniref:hypothetical protein n=1 Tax=Arenibacter sp. S6351L TaxID=2926407 RepID=UPI001FF697FC|nr:hypothetical protein [Arenibacter sp. S6351L]MCK0137310.1 hypothetical protein [Arenibacter sp. S6351L]
MKKIFLAVYTIFLASSIYGQISVKDNVLSIFKGQIPEERIFVYQNTSVLVSGEKLYYSVFCLNEKNNLPSGLSKIAYVELVGKDNLLVFRHKIRLQNGIGQGEFLIPSAVSNGNYKLLGYTRWMNNKGDNYFFKSDLTILNPHQRYKKPTTAKAHFSAIDSVDQNNAGYTLQKSSLNPDKNLKLTTNKKYYNQREQVVLKLLGLNSSVLNGNYSISIRKTDSIDKIGNNNSQNFKLQNKSEVASKAMSNPIYLPELRGELFSGQVITKSTGLPAAYVNVVLSIPEKAFDVKISKADKNGLFYFNVNRGFGPKEPYVHVLQNKGQFEILWDKPFQLDYENLVFDDLVITPDITDIILKRSINAQIENAYSEAKQDSICLEKPYLPFYLRYSKVYDLDDYTRFPTVKETFVEIIDYVQFRKNEAGKQFVNLIQEGFTQSNSPVMVIVDGVFLEDHDKLPDLNARKVKRINVLFHPMVLGPQTFSGLVVFETFNGNFQDFVKDDYVSKVEIITPLDKKKYFNQTYTSNDPGLPDSTSRIPDYRNQLLWIPDFKLEKEETTLDFFTSDVSGDFEVRLEGFSSKGEPISVLETFFVN